MSDLKLYPVMKDSGVPWLGEVPAHWKVLPNRALFTEVNERDHPDEQMLSVTITNGVIPQQA
jgi:type I restriction enzyme S subunit